MHSLFIHIRLLDILDILLVAILLYWLYMIVRGTSAISIIIGILIIYLFWGVVKMLKMELLSVILGQIIGVGVIALIIVFQPEIRRFLLIIGTRYVNKNRFRIENLFKLDFDGRPTVRIKSILKALIHLSAHKTGALIVIKRKSTLDIHAQAGDILHAYTSSRLIISIFNKESPLHDGAIIIDGVNIFAARVVLPVTEQDLPPQFGLRHRAALGITEATDALVFIVSEETGQISCADEGKLENGLSHKRIMQIMESEFQAG